MGAGRDARLLVPGDAVRQRRRRDQVSGRQRVCCRKSPSPSLSDLYPANQLLASLQRIQNRAAAYLAARDWLRFDTEILRNTASSLDTSSIGSLIYDGNTIEASVHWLALQDDPLSPNELELRSCRVLSGLLTPITLPEFQATFSKVMNFLDWMRDVREARFKQIKSLPRIRPVVMPPLEGEEYVPVGDPSPAVVAAAREAAEIAEEEERARAVVGAGTKSESETSNTQGFDGLELGSDGAMDDAGDEEDSGGQGSSASGRQADKRKAGAQEGSSSRTGAKKPKKGLFTRARK